MSRIAIYPGTFDPITNGHLDLLVRATKIFDKVIIAVADNPRKNPLFNIDERIEMIEAVSGDIDNIQVEAFDDLLVNYVGRKNANFVIRGLRAVSDFDYEFQLASANRRLDENVETIFLTPSEANYFISSSLVREISFYQGDVQSFVPKYVEKKVIAKWAAKKRQKTVDFIWLFISQTNASIVMSANLNARTMRFIRVS